MIEKFVATQRADRNDFKYNRDELPQGSLNSMIMTANAQSILNISRVRLCNCASQETREAWKAVLNEISKIDPVLVDKCAPNCVIKGRCPELECCGFDKTSKFKEARERYWKIDY